VGSTKPVPSDVRTIFATNRDLEADVKAGRFREDLYYRINVVPIRVPPLRERREDIPLLVDAFIEQLCALHHKAPKRFTEKAMEQILTYAWPGNIRELKNTVERVVVTCPRDEVDATDLPTRVREATTGPGVLTVELGRSIADVEKDLIQETLRHLTSNRKEAAAILGISVRSLHYKLKKLNLS
jgi:DNA-binding NtrC family response regulator